MVKIAVSGTSVGYCGFHFNLASHGLGLGLGGEEMAFCTCLSLHVCFKTASNCFSHNSETVKWGGGI